MDFKNFLPWAYLKDYFHIDESTFMKSGGDVIRPKCLLCSTKEKEKWVSADKSSSSNLKKHLKRAHPSVFEEFYAVGNVGFKRKIKGENGDDCYASQKKKLGIISQPQVNDFVTNYVIGGLHSIDIVENPEFITLITSLQPSKAVISKQALKTQIMKDANVYKLNLKIGLSNVAYITTTVNCWTTLNRSYVGVTCHWLDPETLGRKTAILGCRRVIGLHSYNTLAQLIKEIHDEYEIEDKVISITADNGLNFVSSLRACGVQSEEDEDYEFIDTFKILNECLSSEKNIFLPPIEQCAANSLNTEAILAGEIAENNTKYGKRFRIVLTKCSNLWSAQKQSESGVVPFTPPSGTKWNSLYESFSSLLDTHSGDSNIVRNYCEEINILTIIEEDIEFITEYCKVLKPVFDALEVLQAETSGYMGVLLPTLHTLHRKLKDQESAELQYCSPLLEALIKGISTRFENEWFRKDLVIAACLHPKFQFKWIKNDDLEARAKAFLLVELQRTETDSINFDSFLSRDDDSDFFDFEQPEPNSDIKPFGSPQSELSIFLDNSTSGDFGKILLLPTVKKMFIRYNTSVPSGAAVEKIFTVRGSLFTKNQGRLPDDFFESLLLLKFQDK